MLRLESELNSFLGWEFRCMVAGRQPLAAWLSCTESSCWLRSTYNVHWCGGLRCMYKVQLHYSGTRVKMHGGWQAFAAWEHLSVFAQTVSLTSHTWMNPNLEPLIYISSPQCTMQLSPCKGEASPYGSVSRGRGKWPFRVLFFFKSRALVWPNRKR